MAAAANSSKSDLKWRVTEITKCPVCLEVCKNPKSLPCLHSFCLHCLQQYWKYQNPGDEVSCPVCRNVLPIPDKGLDKLPHNFFLQNLIEARETSAEQPGVVSCESCEKYGDETEATRYCVDCNQKLCERCSRPHKAMKGGAHQVEELGAKLSAKLIQRRSYCKQHDGKLLELYCFDCKNNICMKCFAVKHMQHMCQEVEMVAEDLRKPSETQIRQVSARISEFHAAVTQTDEENRRLVTVVEELKTSVEHRGETLKRMIDRQVESLTGQLEMIETTGRKEFASRKDGLELGIVAMESFTAYSWELMTKGSACDITRGAIELQARAEELLNTYPNPADCSAPDIKFVPTNVDELSGSGNGDGNLIGRIVTSSDDGKY